MQIYEQKLQEEEKKNGLIIEKALYGNLIIKDKYKTNFLNINEITEEHINGPIIDLTIFLQCKVENSSLLFNEKISYAYFCDIPKPIININSQENFHNILEDNELYLYIRYKYLNIYHEFIIIDRLHFTIPQSNHRIFANNFVGAFSPSNVIKLHNIPYSFFDNIFKFFSKNKIYITLFTTLLFCIQLNHYKKL